MTLDILIPAYRGSPTLTRCVQAALKHTPQPVNVIVACRERWLTENRNYLALYSRAPVVCCMDDDIEVGPGWLAPLLETLETYEVDGKAVGLVAPKVVGPDGSPQNSGNDVGDDERRAMPVSGAIYLYRRDRLPDLMSDTLFARSQWDDMDTTRQVQERGYTTVVDGRVTVLHHHELKGCDRPTWARNSTYFEWKWTGYDNARAAEQEARDALPDEDG